MLVDVGQGLADDVIGGHLDRRRQPLGELDLQLDGYAGAGGQRLQRHRQPVAAQHRGIDAPGDVAKLLQRGRHLRPWLGSAAPAPARRPPCSPPASQFEGERDQPLLGAVVQIAFQPLALLPAGFEHPDPRALQLLQPGAQLGPQPAVLERDAGGRRDGVEQLPLVVQRPVERAAPPSARRRDRWCGPPDARRASAAPPPCPSWSAQLPNCGSQYARRNEGSRSARASGACRSVVGSARSSTSSSATSPRASRASSRANRKAIGASPSAANVISRIVSNAGQRGHGRKVEQSQHDQGEPERVDQQCRRPTAPPAAGPVAQIQQERPGQQQPGDQAELNGLDQVGGRWASSRSRTGCRARPPR